MSLEFPIKFKCDQSGFVAAEKGVQRLAGKFATSQRSMQQLQALLKKTQMLHASTYDANRLRAYASMIERIKGQMKELGSQTEVANSKTQGFFSKMQSSLSKIGSAGLGVSLIRSVVSTGYGIGKEWVQQAGQVEQYQQTLKTLLRSRAGASDRMAEYMDIAKTTPFGLNEVVEAGNKLQSLGQYSRKNLVMLGDLAAASGKPLEQVMTAFSQLATGQKGDSARMFRDLLITQNDWIEATGKGVSRQGELLATTEEMLEALPAIMKKKNFLGMMAEQSQTTAGKISNLNDSLDQLKVAIGERLLPSTSKLTLGLTRIVDRAKEYVEIPTISKIVAEKVEINRLVNELIAHNDNQERRAEIIGNIQRQYPEILKNLDAEKASTQQLRDRLREVNTEYDNRMKKALLSGMVEKLQEKFKDKMDYVTAYETTRYVARENSRLAKEKNALREKYGVSGYSVRDDGSLYRYRDGLAETVSVSTWGDDQQRQWATKTAEQQALQELSKYSSPFMTAEKAAKAKQAAEAYSKSIASLEAQIESLLPKAETPKTEAIGGANTIKTIGRMSLSGSPMAERERSITGGGPKTITINIGKFLDQINLYPQSLGEGTAEIERRVVEMFGRVVAQGGYLGV